MEGVIALHRQNSKRLGFFPSGAFEEKRELRQDFCSLGSGRFTWLPAQTAGFRWPNDFLVGRNNCVAV